MAKVGVQGELARSEHDALLAMIREVEPTSEVVSSHKSLEQLTYGLTLILLDADWKEVVATYLSAQGAISTVAEDVSLLQRISRNLQGTRIIWTHSHKAVRVDFPQDDQQLTKAIVAARRLDLDDIDDRAMFWIRLVWDPVQERWVQDTD